METSFFQLKINGNFIFSTLETTWEKGALWPPALVSIISALINFMAGLLNVSATRCIYE